MPGRQVGRKRRGGGEHQRRQRQHDRIERIGVEELRAQQPTEHHGERKTDRQTNHRHAGAVQKQ